MLRYESTDKWTRIWNFMTTVTVGALVSSLFMGRPVSALTAIDADAQRTAVAALPATRTIHMGVDGRTMTLSRAAVASAVAGVDSPFTLVLHGHVVMPADSSYLFAGLDRLVTIRGSMDASHVTDMVRTFAGDSRLTSIPALAGADVSAVGDMTGAFEGTGLTDLSFLRGWDLRRARNLTRTFAGVPATGDEWAVLTTMRHVHPEWLVRTFAGSGIDSPSRIASWDAGSVRLDAGAFAGVRSPSSDAAVMS
jgi:hypothetical protein